MIEPHEAGSKAGWPVFSDHDHELEHFSASRLLLRSSDIRSIVYNTVLFVAIIITKTCVTSTPRCSAERFPPYYACWLDVNMYDRYVAARLLIVS